ncbi:MAG TPA: DCC1-like thiol-disulfide oxidoreductase family protein [Solirubrobacterales bacterium]|nr:DCC1-like thiol-disulfide oxidoreductase family protein [Solirubrobacterales bacterium]
MTDPWLVLYDGDCGLCKWLLAGLLRFDRARCLRPVALQRPEAEALLADLDPVERMASMHLVSPGGARTSGGEALPALLGLLSGGRLPAAVLGRFPRFTDRAYRWVATHRIGISRFVPRGWKRRAAERVREREALFSDTSPSRG